jgi:thiol-disulfide isomerase/thioredoxin
VDKGKIVIGAFLAMVLVVGLYFINRNWIAPIAMRQAHASGISAAGNHPIAPDFSLTGISGQKINLADYKGKVLMVDFWATWCGPCRVEIPGFVELENRYRDQGFAIIGISKDDGPDEVKEFYQEFKMNYPVALANDDVDQLYGGIIGLPTTFLIGRDGRIYAKHTGTTDVSVFEEEVKTLLAAKPDAEVANFKPAFARSADEIEVKTPEQVKAENNPDVPGVDVGALNAPQLAHLKQTLKTQQCTCGCNMNVLECRHKDPGCGVSRKMAKEQMGKLTKKTA